MRQRSMLGSLQILGIGLLALAGAGCSGRGDVTGAVRCEGKSLVFGTVQLEASDGRLHNGIIEEDGTYFIPAVARGEAKVAVSSLNPTSSIFQPLHREGLQGMPNAPKAVKGWFPIPSKYELFATSGLTVTVNAGENQIDLDLKK